MINPLLQKALPNLGFDRVRVYLLSEDGQRFTVVAHHGMPHNFIGVQRSFAEEVLGELADPSTASLFQNGNHKGVVTEFFSQGDYPNEWAGIGLWRRGELRGLITADNKLSNTQINQDLLTTLSVFADQVHQAIAGEEMKTMTDTSSPTDVKDRIEGTISNLECHPLFRIVIQGAVQLLRAESGGIYEYYAENGELLLVAEDNLPEHVGTVLKVGDGVAGRLVLDNGHTPEEWDTTAGSLDDGTKYRIVDNYKDWPGRAKVYDDGHLAENVLAVQLKWHDQIIGVLYVDALKDRRFSKEDAQLLKRFADDAAIAMAQVKKLSRLSRIMKELMGDLETRTLDERLNQIAKYAAEMVEAEVCGVFLVKDGKLRLEASYGHREGAFQKGKPYEIRTGVGTGLTGHIAFAGKPFNKSGEELTRHPAVRGVEPDCSPSHVCTSLLAIPLHSKQNGEEKLMGLIRASNKLDRDRKSIPPVRFSEEDEWILTIFAETVVTAIEGALLVDQLKEREGQLSGMVVSSPCGIIASASDGRITEFNDKAKSILGYEPDDPHPAHVSEVYFSEEDAREVGAQLHRNNGKLEKYRTDVRGKGGQRIPLLLSATWLYDGDNNRVGSVGYFEDLRPAIANETRLALYYEANSIVATADSPSQGLQNLAEKLISVLKNSFCRILLLDESGQYLTVEAAYPIKRETAFRWTPGINQRVALADYEGLEQFLHKGESRVLRWSKEECRPILEKLSNRLSLQTPVQSLLVVPLRLGKKVVGLLDIGDVRAPRVAANGAHDATTGMSERRKGPMSLYFSHEQVEMVTNIAAQTSFLIERIKLFEIAERRRKLLERLDEKARELQGVNELSKLRRDVIIYALDLINGRESMAGVLFVNHQLPQKLEPVSVFGVEFPKNETFSHSDGVIGKVVKDRKTIVVPRELEYADCEAFFPYNEFSSMLAIPLFHAGEVTHVLAVADRSPSFAFGDAERETLQRFGAQAAIALHAAKVMSPERRTFHHLEILHQITEVILREQETEKVLHAFLTGITAGYGLGFNRAAIFLLDETGETLVGHQGIGHVDQDHAERDWEHYHERQLDSFKSYREHRENGNISSTPIGDWTPHYSLNLQTKRSDVFRWTLSENKWSLIPESDLQILLPRDFLYGFRPTTDVVIVPLHTREKAVGVIVADNKFTKAMISNELVESLMTYANMAALAIENIRLIERIELNRRKMQNLFAAGTTLRTTSDPKRTLKDILKLTQTAAEASWVRIILIDELGHPHELLSIGTESDPPLDQVFLPDGISRRVMQQHSAVAIENTHRTKEPLNAALISKELQASVCLPLSMQGRDFGVIWIGYSSPRVFHDTIIESLQLFVNQAAIAYDSARRMEELEQIRHAVEALADTDSVQHALESILERTKTALRADSAAIWTYDDKLDIFKQDGWVSYNISSDLNEAFRKERPRPGGTASTVMQQGLIAVKDIQDKSYSYLGEATRRLLRQIRVQSFIGVSLAVGHEKLGVLYVNYGRPRNFSDEEKEIARTVANYAAMALKRAKLFDQLQKTKKAAEAVADVTVIGDHEQTLNEIVKDAATTIECDAVTLFVYDKATDKLKHPPYMYGVRDPKAATMNKEVDRNSIVYKILERERPEFIDDAENAPLTKDSRFRKDEGIKSLVGIPLSAGGERVGVMFVNYLTPRTFYNEDQENIKFFADLAAAAISNAQVFERRREEQKNHLDLSKDLLAEETVTARMQIGVDIAARMLHAEFCAVVLPEDAGEDLMFCAAYGWDQEIIERLKLKASYGSQSGFTIDQRGPVIVSDFQSETRFDVHPVLTELGLRSSISVPMFEGDEVSGVILIHARQVDHFSPYDVGLLTLIANQLAVAMQSAREINRKQQGIDALYKASKAIAASFRLDPQLFLYDYKSVLSEIIKQAVEGVTAAVGITSGGGRRKATLGMIKLYNASTDELTLESLYAPELQDNLLEKIGPRRSAVVNNGGHDPIGVVGLAIKTKETQLVPDVSKCPDYVQFESSTRSELVTPLIIDGEVRGVINLESDRLNGFDEHDKQNLEAFRELAVVVIKNAELFNELIKTKGMVDSNKALAGLGMLYSAWGHAIEGHAINIKNLPTLMRAEIADWALSQEQRDKLEERLTRIENMAEKILRRDMYPPLDNANDLEICSVHDLINDRITPLWQDEPYSKVQKRLILGATNPKARVNSIWFGHALDILIDNAVTAMEGCKLQSLNISTLQKKNTVQINVSDTGKGIPDEKQQYVLNQQPVPVGEGEKGLGVGLLFARMIIETYNGTLELKETNSRGTTFIITLPTAE